MSNVEEMLNKTCNSAEEAAFKLAEYRRGKLAKSAYEMFFKQYLFEKRQNCVLEFFATESMNGEALLELKRLEKVVSTLDIEIQNMIAISDQFEKSAEEYNNVR